MDNLNFVAIDFETATELKESICEIGITVVENSRIVESKSWLVKPLFNEYDPFNIDIHGIPPAMTENSPEFPDVWKDVEPYLSGQIVVAHHVAFDMYALKYVLETYQLPFPSFKFYCSCKIARYVIPDCDDYKLSTICNTLQIPIGIQHRALEDSKMCAEVFINLVNRSGVKTLEELESRYIFHCGYFSSDKFVPSLSCKKNIKAKDITGDSDLIDTNNYFYGKNVCFTGAFKYGSRYDLQKTIKNIGGEPVDSVTKKTDILVVGQQDYRVVGDSGMSAKQRKAISLQEKGHHIEIMSEVDFLLNL